MNDFTITCKNINLCYSGFQVLDDFSISFCNHTSLVGPSGAGKTTLLRVLAGLQSIDSGAIYGLEHKKKTYLFQEDRLFPWLTIKENVSLFSDLDTAIELLYLLGLEAFIEQKPHTLSGGMRRRVAIARTLAVNADLLLLDEVGKGMDEKLREKVYSLILNMWKEKMIILVTHDKYEAKVLGKSIVQLAGPPLRIQE